MMREEVKQTHPNIVFSLVSPGVVATEFGNNAVHGGTDSHKVPDAQSAVEVAAIIAGVIESRAPDTYTRKGSRDRVAVYYASKAYVLSFSEAIRTELEETGVTVTTLCPGPTRTAFADRAEVSRNRFMSSRVMEPFEVAREGYAGMMAGRSVVIPGKVNRLGAAGARLAPRSLVSGIARRIHEADEPG
jgi:short-subunit dehydrogenase